MARYLVGDIGGTNARFARADGHRILDPKQTVETAQVASSAALFATLRQARLADAVEGCCFAVAGPVIDSAARLTNTPAAYSEVELSRLFGCPVRLVNDFYALAVGLPAIDRYVKIGGTDPVDLTKAVLGPGTGLGMAFTIPTRGGWRTFATEGGHADLAVSNHLELEVLAHLLADSTQVSWESVLSGPGLVRLYGAVAQIWGVPAQPLTPEQITEQGAALTDPVCHQTLEMFCGFLGAAAGNLAVTLNAAGGVYLAGGVVAGIRTFLPDSPLRRRFSERGPTAGYLDPVPLLVIDDPSAGLVGAQRCLPDVRQDQSDD